MSERDGYAPGEFGWVDVAMADIEAGTAFYAELFGWTVEQAPNPEQTGGYGFFFKDGKQVAGYGPLMAEGQPPAWSSYVYVGDADATAAKIRDAGGTVLTGPMDLPADAGRMAVCQDPQGAFFSVFEPGEHKGARLVNEPGSWTWNHLATSDLDGAKSFYGDVFGWGLERSKLAPDSPSYMWQVEGQRWEEGIAGAMEMGEGDFPPGVPPHWMVYFAVEDADAAVRQTTDAGGQVMAPPMDIPVGRMAVLTDPQGAPFAVIQPSYPAGR